MSSAVSSWQPQQAQLGELVKYLRDSQDGRDPAARKQAETMLKSAQDSPEINNYFCYLLADGTLSETSGLGQEALASARGMAGILLKNDIRSKYKTFPESTKSYLHANILRGLFDTSPQIRNQTGSVITELVRQGSLMSWPTVLQDLTSLIANQDGSANQNTQEGAMGALLKVCEDNRKSLSRTYEQNQCPLDVLVPNLMEFAAHQSAKIRANAIQALTVFIPDKADALLRQLDSVLGQLFNLAQDPSEDVRKFVCRAIVQIAGVSPEKVAPHMQGLVDYMITQHRNMNDQELALEAAEFWLFVAEDRNLREGLRPFLSKVVPVLLESMVYDEDEIIRLEGEAEDAEQEDKESEIKPRFATSKASRAVGGGAGEDAANGNDANGSVNQDDDELSEGELEEYDEEDGEDDPEAAWTLRKCSAAALDTLATAFPAEVFATTLPYLKTNLVHEEWPNREAAVLAIGAIAEGCMDVVTPHLPELVPFLINRLQDPEPIVRQITCWSLGRYSSWAAHLDEVGKQQFFLPMMDGILKRMLDNNKRVQEAAASAFANLEEKANKQLENPIYCEVIARQFAACFAKYKDRNMFILYDCVQTLAEHVGPTLQKPELVHVLMPALINRWEKVSDAAREIFTLQECLSYVATALGPAFSPYAEPIYSRCVNIIYQNLQDTFAHAQEQAVEEPEPDFLITSLDLISAIIQALGDKESLSLVKKVKPDLFDLLQYCLENKYSETKQSAYALLGDCAIYVYSELEPSLPILMPILIQQLDFNSDSADSADDGYPVANNACWSSGEIALRAGSKMQPYVEQLLQRFYAILASQAAPTSLQENAAIALGRLGSGSAEILAPHLATIAPMFINPMKNIGWTEEKAHAMKGMTQVILQNPQGIEPCLLEYLNEIARVGAHEGTFNWLRAEPSGCLAVLKQALVLFKELIPNFEELASRLPAENQPGISRVLLS